MTLREPHCVQCGNTSRHIRFTVRYCSFGCREAALRGDQTWDEKMRDFPQIPIYDQLVRELYAQRTEDAYAASPDMIGCGQWELLPPERLASPDMRKRRIRTDSGAREGCSGGYAGGTQQKETQ
jgi:hypothetical protein